MRQSSSDGAVGSIGLRERSGQPAEAALKRAAVELVARHEATLMRTARRFSLCADDAEDAFQRALEILLTKAPTDEMRELLPWMQTVTKHEALAIRRKRERLLGTPPRAAGEDEELDWLSLVPSSGDGPPEKAVRHEAISRSREALRALKPAELRALTLLAEGYSYAEISEMTGFSRTKVNRCLAEGRERFRKIVAESEGGDRCAELRPLLSAYCDGEASERDAEVLREHLRACAHCRSVLRSYRLAPPAAAALAPALPLWASLGRSREALGRLRGRLPGRGGGPGKLAGAGTHGTGLGVAVKTVAVCAAAAGVGAAGMAGGLLPTPGGQDLTSAGTSSQAQSRLQPTAPHVRAARPSRKAESGRSAKPRRHRRRHAQPAAPAPDQASAPAPEQPEAAAPPPPAEAPAPEYEEAAPEPAPSPAPAEGGGGEPSSGSPAGEFGP